MIETLLSGHRRHFEDKKFKNMGTGRFMAPAAALTLKAPITTAVDDIHKYFSLFFRENKT